MTKLIVMDGVDLKRTVMFSNPNSQSAMAGFSEEVKRITERIDREFLPLWNTIDYIQRRLSDGDITVTPNSIMLTTYKVSGDGEIPHTIRILNYL